MNKSNKLGIYRDVRNELLSMKPGDTDEMFAPNGGSNTVECSGYSELSGIMGYEINGCPMTRIREIIALLTRDVLKYWEQNPEEAKASGLV